MLNQIMCLHRGEHCQIVLMKEAGEDRELIQVVGKHVHQKYVEMKMTLIVP